MGCLQLLEEFSTLREDGTKAHLFNDSVQSWDVLSPYIKGFEPKSIFPRFSHPILSRIPIPITNYITHSHRHRTINKTNV